MIKACNANNETYRDNLNLTPALMKTSLRKQTVPKVKLPLCFMPSVHYSSGSINGKFD